MNGNIWESYINYKNSLKSAGPRPSTKEPCDGTVNTQGAVGHFMFFKEAQHHRDGFLVHRRLA